MGKKNALFKNLKNIDAKNIGLYYKSIQGGEEIFLLTYVCLCFSVEANV